MATPPLSSVEVECCLRGAVGGVEQTFVLLPGENRVGSLDGNEIFLPRRGVSRAHALLLLDGQGLTVADLKSKNGTFVNGQRVEHGQVELGDKVRFGPVELTFQEYHRDDAELAIAFEPALTDQTSVIPIVESPLSGAGLGGALSRHWLRVAEAFHARLFSQPSGDMGAALRLLVEELHLTSASVLELPAGQDPIVLAAAGQLDRGALRDLKLQVGRFLDEDPRQDIHFHTAPTVDDSPESSFAVLIQSGADPLVLALHGGFPGRSKSELLIRLLVRMLDPCRPKPAPGTREDRSARYPGLVVPPGYVYAQSAAMRKIYELMQTLAQGDLPILILGETGAGKEYLAHILHDSSPRRRGPFVAINCAAIPAEMLEAELFGIGDKVATGVAASKGRLQMAHGGTLFLDEIGDMSADLQAKLLRALQEKEIHPVGRDPVSIDVRVVAATNQDLKKRIDGGAFRADLYYRLAGYVLEIPSLRERPEDVPALVEYFLRDCARELSRPIRGLTVRALRLLTEYPWPGNVRELANEVRRAVYICPENGTIDSSILSQTLRDHRPEPPAANSDAATTGDGWDDEDPLRLPAPMGLGLDSLDLEHLESQAIREALRRCDDNQVQAAKLLGISRQSLRRRMERLGLL